MKIGTKSVLFGAHCWFIHPWFVAAAWSKLYGFPTDPRLWVAFFVHDLGYWGKPNIDGPEGESHVEFGARVMGWFDVLESKRGDRLPVYPYWYDLTLYHSRFYAKKHGQNISKLCVADKLAICLEPAWLYLPRVWASGELAEFREVVKTKYANEHRNNTSVKAWRQSMIDFLLPWVEDNKGSAFG